MEIVSMHSDEKLNVLHLVDNMGIGGAQKILVSLAEIFSIHSIRRMENEISSCDYSVTQSFSRYNLRCLVDIYRILDRKEIDIVHCHLVKSKIVGLLVVTLAGGNQRLIFHEHGHIWRESRVYNIFLRFTRHWVDGYVAVSEHTEKLLVERADISQSDIEVVYNFSGSEFTPEEVEGRRLDLPEELRGKKFIIGFAGRLIRRKGWRTLIEAAEKLDSDIGIVFVGSGPESEDLGRRAEELDNTVYLGFIEDVRDFLGTVDGFVLPSRWDPSPVILYEVCSSGVPVVCSNVKSIDELIEEGKNGLLFPESDSIRLAERIEELYRNPELRNQLSSIPSDSTVCRGEEDYLYELQRFYREIKEE